MRFIIFLLCIVCVTNFTNATHKRWDYFYEINFNLTNVLFNTDSSSRNSTVILECGTNFATGYSSLEWSFESYISGKKEIIYYNDTIYHQDYDIKKYWKNDIQYASLEIKNITKDKVGLYLCCDDIEKIGKGSYLNIIEGFPKCIIKREYDDIELCCNVTHYLAFSDIFIKFLKNNKTEIRGSYRRSNLHICITDILVEETFYTFNMTLIDPRESNRGYRYSYVWMSQMFQAQVQAQQEQAQQEHAQQALAQQEQNEPNDSDTKIIIGIVLVILSLLIVFIYLIYPYLVDAINIIEIWRIRASMV